MIVHRLHGSLRSLATIVLPFRMTLALAGCGSSGTAMLVAATVARVLRRARGALWFCQPTPAGRRGCAGASKSRGYLSVAYAEAHPTASTLTAKGKTFNLADMLAMEGKQNKKTVQAVADRHTLTARLKRS
ncbi:MAG: hypothetical protein ABSF53_22475 [Terracidiphilus sp.]|jgi:hypothetical protein